MIPNRKITPLQYITKYGKMTIYVKQATIWELDRFDTLLEQNRTFERWNNFVKENAKIELERPYKPLRWMKGVVVSIILKNYPEIITEVYSKRSLGHKSIYTNISLPWATRKSPKWYDMWDVCIYRRISPQELRENYTREQYEWMIEYMTFKSFESDKKTRKYNDMAMAKKWNTLTKQQQELNDLINKTRLEWWFEKIEGATFTIEAW